MTGPKDKRTVTCGIELGRLTPMPMLFAMQYPLRRVVAVSA